MLPKLMMEGRLTNDPDLRFLESGVAVCSFTIVANDRKKNDDTGQWEDVGDPLFVRATVWRQPGENAAESLSKGDLVVVYGKLSNRKWEDKEGNTRYSLEITADIVAPSLQFRAIKHGTERRSQQKQGTADPWATPPSDDSEPPF